MDKKISKAIRVITLPSVMAFILVVLMRGQYPTWHAAAAIFFLSILPTLSYAVWRVVPKLYEGGRPSQRKLAVVFSVIGYFCGLAFCFLFSGSSTELIIYLCYVISGTLIFITSKFFGFKSSGHASGITGPIAILVLRLSPWYIVGLLLLIPIWKSSVNLGRHTNTELFCGCLYPVVAALALNWLLP